MSLKQITPPSDPAVSLAEIKLACRIDGSDLDTELEAMVLDATRLVEHETGRSVMAQTWALTLDAFPAAFRLSRGPVGSVTSIVYTDSTGVVKTLSSAAYTLADNSAHGPASVVPVYGTSWPTTRSEINAVTVTYVAGAATAAEVPSQIKRQIKIFVAMMLDDPLALGDRLAAIDKVYAA